jgi:hypothetical protein
LQEKFTAMSFQIKNKLHVCHSCHDKGKFTLTDVTGPWDATLNPFGWQPNSTTPQTQIKLQDVASSALTITSPSGTVYGPYDIYPTLPNLDGTELTVDLSDILDSGDDAPYEDGYWDFDWVVKGEYPDGVGGETPFHARCLKSELVLCDVQCCTDKFTADSDPSCGCSGKGNTKAIDAMLTLEAIQAADRCGQKETAKKHLKNLQALCGKKCKNC